MSNIFPEYDRVIEQKKEEQDLFFRQTFTGSALFQYNHNKMIEEHKIKEDKIKVWIEKYARPATVNDYIEWLKGYSQNGGKPSHYYDYNFPQNIRTSGFYVLKNQPPKDDPLPPSHGAGTINIIVPFGLLLEPPLEHTHSSIYYMDGFTNFGHDVSVYSNT